MKMEDIATTPDTYITVPVNTSEKEEDTKDIITDAEIIESINIPFELMENFLLIKPLKPANIKKRVEILDEKKNKGKMPHEVMHTKRVTKSVQTDYREGIVLLTGPRMGDYSISPGDKVVFHKSLVDRSWFDLFKDTLLLRTYDIVAKAT